MADEKVDHYVEGGEKTDYKVYTRRWFIAWSLAIGYALWNWTGNRHVILAEAYSKYYNQPAEFSLIQTGDPGIDALTILSNVVLVMTYIPCALAVDKFGIRMMWIGNGVLALAAWIWYLAGTSFAGALASVILGSTFGPLLSTSLLATSNKWFPEHERGRATGLITVTSLLGAGLSVVAPAILGVETSAEKVDVTLPSCQATAGTLAAAANATFNNVTLFCADFPNAVDEFCCVADADVAYYDFLLAIFVTASAVFTVAAVRDRPPTPPSGGADAPNLPKIVPAFKHIFKWPDHQNFVFIMLADFLVGGPPKVVFATIARILPPAVAELDTIAVGLGFVLVIPTVLILAYLLDYKKLYYPVVRGAFTFGFVCYVLLAICLAAGTVEAEYAFLALLIFAVVAVLAWQVGVFELKLEYVFTPEYSVEGLVIGTDRFVVNLGSAVFLSFLAPEIVGRNNVFNYGLGIMAVGLFPLYLGSGKMAYKRMEYEQEKDVRRRSSFLDKGFEGVAT